MAMASCLVHRPFIPSHTHTIIYSKVVLLWQVLSVYLRYHISFNFVFHCARLCLTKCLADSAEDTFRSSSILTTSLCFLLCCGISPRGLPCPLRWERRCSVLVLRRLRSLYQADVVLFLPPHVHPRAMATAQSSLTVTVIVRL